MVQAIGDSVRCLCSCFAGSNRKAPSSTGTSTTRPTLGRIAECGGSCRRDSARTRGRGARLRSALVPHRSRTCFRLRLHACPSSSLVRAPRRLRATRCTQQKLWSINVVYGQDSHGPTHQQGTPFGDERQTVGQFLERWLEYKQPRLRPRAWLTYEQAVRLHLAPGLGRIPLTRLTPVKIETWFREHHGAGATPRNIRYARTVLRAALNQARKWQMVHENVAALVEPPRHQTKQIQPLTPEQARTLLDAVKEHRLGALISVATALGLRLGEALGLKWAAVSFDAGTLSVRQALERSGGDSAARRPLIAERRELRKKLAAAPKRSVERRELRQQLATLRSRWRKHRTTLQLTEPKSIRSRRTIRMPKVVVAALNAHRKTQLENGSPLAVDGRILASCSPRRSGPPSIPGTSHARFAGC